LGQKVHPLGFRLVSTQKHRSIWFEKFKNYPQLILEDFLIRNFFETKNRKAGIAKIEIKRNNSLNKIEVIIYSGRPGLFVGISGIGLTFMYSTLNKLTNQKRNITINIIEIKKPNANANLIGESIVDQLEKRILFRRAVQNAIKLANSENILGIIWQEVNGLGKDVFLYKL